MPNYDPRVAALNAHPPFLREYWRGIQDAVNGPLLASNVEPILDTNYAALYANGVNVLPPSAQPSGGCTTSYTLKSWIAGRRSVLTNELAKVASIRVNGATNAVLWTSVTNWSISRTLTNGANPLTVQGYGRTNNVLTGMLDSITVTYQP